MTFWHILVALGFAAVLLAASVSLHLTVGLEWPNIVRALRGRGDA